MPCSQSERIERKRFLQASDGVNTCLPDASGVQSISSGLLTTCTTPPQAASVFALQVWKGICYLYGLILTIQSQLMRTPGVVNVAVGATLGAGASVSVVGNDTAGQITINCGTGGGGAGSMVDFTFLTPYETAGTLVVIPQNLDCTQEPSIGTDCAVGAASLKNTNDSLSVPYVGQTMVYNYYVAGGT